MIRRILAVLLAGTVLLSGCSSDDPAPASTTAPAPDAKALIAAAHQKLIAAKAIAIVMTSSGVPDNVAGVMGAEGDGLIDQATPKFKGKATGRLQGMSGNFDVIAIGEKTWIKFFTPGYVAFDLARIGATSPALLFQPETGLASVLPQLTEAAIGEQKREGSEVLTTITGKIPGATLKKLLMVGTPETVYQADFGLTETQELRTVSFTGEFFPGATSTYRLVLSGYGKTVDIQAP